jgi:hypothetical protein
MSEDGARTVRALAELEYRESRERYQMTLSIAGSLGQQFEGLGKLLQGRQPTNISLGSYQSIVDFNRLEKTVSDITVAEKELEQARVKAVNLGVPIRD